MMMFWVAGDPQMFLSFTASVFFDLVLAVDGIRLAKAKAKAKVKSFYYLLSEGIKYLIELVLINI